MINQTAIAVWPRKPEVDQAQRVSFAALYGFTLLLYLRPQEMFPDVFGDVPISKIAALIALGAFLVWRMRAGDGLTRWPIELKMLIVIGLLGLALTPVAKSPSDSLDQLGNVFLKVLIVFALMINVIDTEDRLTAILKLVVVLSAFMALAAVYSYMTGRFIPRSSRISGLTGFFGNPNDLATSLDLVIPFAIVLCVARKGLMRLFFAACAVALFAGVIVTFSRGGFLGLAATLIFLVWKLSRARKALAMAVVTGAIAVFLVTIPAGYGGRLGSIFNPSSDVTGSAEARLNLLTRATELALTHPIVGLGLGNFHIYSIEEQRAHNSYLEISAELGVLGLVAYLIVLFGPFRYLRRIEKETSACESPSGRFAALTQPNRLYYLTVAIQAALIGYAVCSFFGSMQYIWDLYYIVAYAVALKQISHRERGAKFVHNPPRKLQRGVLWSNVR